MTKTTFLTTSRAIWVPVLLLSAALCCLGAQAQLPDEPRIFHVNGDYTGQEVEGTLTRPYKTIAAALSVVIPELGDTVRVLPGRYNERFLVPPDCSLIGVGGADETFIVGDPDVQEVLLALTSGALLQGFTLGPTGGNSVLIPEGVDATVRNCVMHGGFSGIGVATGGTVRAVNNTFFGNQISLNVEPGGAIADARNNIFAADGIGILLGQGATAVTAYNNFFGNGPSVVGGSPSETDFGGNPGISNGADGIFHVFRSSITRNTGDPNAAFNDTDGTRNNLGAYGGPNAIADVLAPRIAVSGGVTAQAPFTVELDLSGSSDPSGVAEYAFDGNLSDGTSFEPAEGPQIAITYDSPGVYLAAVRITDNEGNASIQRFYAGGIEGRPFINASKRASDPPFRTELSAIAAGDITSVAWDLDSDGDIESRGFRSTFLIPEGSLPGSYWVTLRVDRTAQPVSSLATLPLTLTESNVVALQEIIPGAEDITLTAALGGPLAGTTVTIPADATSELAVAAIAEPNPADYLAPPQGALVAIAEFGPRDLALSRPAVVSIPARAEFDEDAQFHVYRWDHDGELWTNSSALLLRVSEGSPPRLELQLPQLGLYAVSASTADSGNGGGNNGGGGGFQCRPVDQTPVRPASMAGDGLVAGGLMALLLIHGIYHRRKSHNN